MSLYQRIKDLREDADKTQTEVAEYLGTTAQYYGKYENGERELPFARAIKLAQYYNVSLDYLAGISVFGEAFGTKQRKDRVSYRGAPEAAAEKIAAHQDRRYGFSQNFT